MLFSIGAGLQVEGPREGGVNGGGGGNAGALWIAGGTGTGALLPQAGLASWGS